MRGIDEKENGAGDTGKAGGKLVTGWVLERSYGWEKKNSNNWTPSKVDRYKGLWKGVCQATALEGEKTVGNQSN